MASELPRTKPTSVRLSEADFEHLRRLQDLLGRRSYSDLLSLGVTHLLACVERDERIYLTVPSDEPEGPEDR